MIADLKERGPNTVTPFVIVNFSHHEHLHLPKDHVVAFRERLQQRRNARNLHHGTTRKRATQELDTRKKMQEKFSEFFENPFMQKDDDFLKSPAGSTSAQESTVRR